MPAAQPCLALKPGVWLVALALAAMAMINGAKILRVHDVPETVDVVRMIAAVQSAK